MQRIGSFANLMDALLIRRLEFMSLVPLRPFHLASQDLRVEGKTARKAPTRMRDHCQLFLSN
jgi:hypothetical protein